MTATEIPGEIMREAQRIAEIWMPPGSFGCDVLVQSIGRALMARDQRAADMLKAYASEMLGRGTIGSKWVARVFEAQAAAILTYSDHTQISAATPQAPAPQSAALAEERHQ